MQKSNHNKHNKSQMLSWIECFPSLTPSAARNSLSTLGLDAQFSCTEKALKERQGGTKKE